MTVESGEPPADFFELPSVVSVRTDPLMSAVSQTLLVLPGGLPIRLSDPVADWQEQANGDGKPDSLTQALDELIDDHIDFVREAIDEARLLDAARGDGRIGAGRLLDTAGLVERWVDHLQPHLPPRRLIARLAEQLVRPLQELATRPRRVLARTRQLQPVAAVQQVDAACLRWISRQPGRTVTEKAGPRQRVLGVQRVEQTNTLENRVVRDVLLRCRNLCQAYIDDYGHLKHERTEGVRAFGRLVDRTLRDSEFSSVGPLAEPVIPNYVLQQEPRYAAFWRARQMLIYQRRLRDRLFQWRRRLVAEIAWLGTAAAVRRLGGQPAYRSDVLVEERAVHGALLRRDTGWLGFVKDAGEWELQPVGGGGKGELADFTLRATSENEQTRQISFHVRVPGEGDCPAAIRLVGPDPSRQIIVQIERSPQNSIEAIAKSLEGLLS